jgi:hypothetical protein
VYLGVKEIFDSTHGKIEISLLTSFLVCHVTFSFAFHEWFPDFVQVLYFFLLLSFFLMGYWSTALMLNFLIIIR